MVKVVKATGLIPVFAQTNAAYIFGVSPEVAGELVANKTHFLAEIPDHIETEDRYIPLIDDVAKEGDEDGDGHEPETAGPVEIPTNWEDQHWMKNDKLAKTIAGDKYDLPEGTKAVDYNNTIIREEIQRRADAADAQADADQENKS